MSQQTLLEDEKARTENRTGGEMMMKMGEVMMKYGKQMHKGETK